MNVQASCILLPVINDKSESAQQRMLFENAINTHAVLIIKVSSPCQCKKEAVIEQLDERGASIATFQTEPVEDE